jgi:subtilisin family serine protease
VRWAMRDRPVQATAVTGQDAYWGHLWGLHNTGQSILGQGGVADADMDVTEAWARSTGAGVTVAVVDSGVQLDHPDLAGQVAANPGETGAGREANGVDDDGNGLVDDWRGWDFVQADNDPADVQGHGTHVAGTVAAVNGNGQGISGAAPDARVLSLRTLDDNGSGYMSDTADAFDLAGDMGVRVVNASLGGAGTSPAITQAVGAHPNTLYVVAAGNDTLNLESGTDYFPCEAPAGNVLCVGASDNRDAIADFSNYGTTAVDVFAPGVNVLSTYKNSGYAYMGGTSMASPHVAAAAALLVADDPTLTAAQVKSALMGTVDEIGGLPSVAGGRVNADRALPGGPAAPADDDPPAPGDDVPPIVEPLQPPPPVETPKPAPVLSSVAVKLSACARARGDCLRRPQVSVGARAGASVRLVVDHLVSKRWRTVTSARATVPARGATVVRLPRWLPAGSYRLTVTATAAGAPRATRRTTFRVRG